MSKTIPKKRTFASLSEAQYWFQKEALEREVDFMNEYDIDYNAMLFMKILYFEEYTLLFKYLSGGKPISELAVMKEKFKLSEINNLHHLGFLDNRWSKIDSPYPDMVYLSKNFIDTFGEVMGVSTALSEQIRADNKFKAEFAEMKGEELFENYPSNSKDGYQLKACNPIEYNSKMYQGRRKIMAIYSEIIGYDEAKHNEVIRKIGYDRSKGFLTCNVMITKFVTDSMWNDIADKVPFSNGLNL